MSGELVPPTNLPEIVQIRDAALRRVVANAARARFERVFVPSAVCVSQSAAEHALAAS